MNSRGNFIGGFWQAGKGQVFSSTNPMDGETLWQGQTAAIADVNAAIASARMAAKFWAHRPMAARIELLKSFQTVVKVAKEKLSQRISLETGKPFWEAKQEVDSLIAKVDNSIEAQSERAGRKEATFKDHRGVLRYRPHGVLAVLGPFNLPAHLTHSHIIPALLAGNTVVFKPSECTPWVGEMCMELWIEAGLPPGVVNVIQGGREAGEALSKHEGIDGLLFTGSHRAGLALSRIFANTPGKILALELGGNNPMLVWEPHDLSAASEWIVQSAFITAGQRCTCARRLILPQGEDGDALLLALQERMQNIIVGGCTDTPEPFLGPLIHATAATFLLDAQKTLLNSGAKILIPMQTSPRSKALLTPGLIDCSEVNNLSDEEFFGPLLQVFRVPNFESALELANHTKFGLSAGLISGRQDLWEQFLSDIKAGIVNWNRPTTGASGKFPFGGIGESGNHRPSAFTAADYCQYPVASLENESGVL